MDYDYRTDPVLGGALAYWRRRRGDRAMPSRRDIDPADMPLLLPHLQLIDLLPDDRFRYRLVGTALVEAFGRDYTGQTPDELFDGPRAQKIIEVFAAVRQARQPIFLRSQYLTTKDIELVANRLYLPLSEDGSRVNMILGTLTFRCHEDSVAGSWGPARLALSEAAMVAVEAAPDPI